MFWWICHVSTDTTDTTDKQQVDGGGGEGGGRKEGPNLITAKTGMSSDPNEIQTWLRQKAAEEEEEGEASVWYL